VGESEFSREDANQLLYKSGIDKGVTKKIVSGKELFSMILPKIDFVNDSIEIKDGKIIRGIIDKTTFGDEDGELIKVIDSEYGRRASFNAIRMAFNIGKNFLPERGITSSVEDFDLDEKLIKESDKIIQIIEIQKNRDPYLFMDCATKVIPGKSVEESREIHILKILNEVRTKVGTIVKKEFPLTNPVSHMMKSGGGGNILNITQMASCVGQQAFVGGRVNIGYSERTLSFFKKKDLSPESRGFIRSSFIKGLRPDEFFFQAITGRDSLMDTGLRTPKSGYLYRRLASSFQDIRKEYDGTIRDGGNNIIQFTYGDDGLDVSKIHLKNGELAPGEAIGLVAAQSFGEASTQMVLNTFHMAGVAEMQVTTGLPRIIEIFDARKKPSSPKMEIYLDKNYNNEGQAKIIAEKIKEIKLKEIASEVNLDFGNKKIQIVINKKSLKQTHSSISK